MNVNLGARVRPKKRGYGCENRCARARVVG
jgi:hypothetical protein